MDEPRRRDPAIAPKAPPPHDPDSESSEDRQFATAEKLVGTAMMFIGFLNVLLSISGGFEINVFPLILYFAGLAIWAHSAIDNPTARYAVITVAIVLGLAFFHYGEVHFWHKQVIFWTTVLLVSFFMFKGASSK
jgi:hypothetical protein